MYMKDLKHKMTLRLNDEMKAYVEDMASKYCVSPSDFIRQCVAINMDSRKTAEALLEKFGNTNINGLMEGLENGTDRKTDIDDKLQ